MRSSQSISRNMKVVHLAKEKKEIPDLASEAKELEASNRKHPNDKAFNRLMQIYRKLKDPGRELQVINTAIKIFEAKLKDRQPTYNKKVAALSKALRKATGLADPKGNNLFEPGELAKWKKRKAGLMKRKLKATNKN
jgi:hypothetical protein